MGEKTTVAFRVDESVKSNWEEAAESPEYDSLSHLIRLSVQKEIAETESPRGETQPSADLGGDSEVLESLTRLERTVDSIQDELNAVGREDRAEELYDLEQVLFEILPVADNSLEDYTPGEGMDLHTPGEGRNVEPLTPEDAANRIGADIGDVTTALNALTEKTTTVQRSEEPFGDEVRYWRRE